MTESNERLAAALADAWRAGSTILCRAAPPASRADAYAIQDRMAELIGESVLGWKVGATAKAVQILEGHDGPILGRVLGSRPFTSPATLLGALFDGCKLECEIAFRFTSDVPARAERYSRDAGGTCVFCSSSRAMSQPRSRTRARRLRGWPRSRASPGLMTTSAAGKGAA